MPSRLVAIAAPLATLAALLALFVGGVWTPSALGVALAAGGYLAARALTRPVRRHALLLPLMRYVDAAAASMLATAGLVIGSEPPPPLLAVAITLLACVFGTATSRQVSRVMLTRAPQRRIALIGSARVARALRAELGQFAGTELVGRLAVSPGGHQDAELLGTIADVHDIVAEHGIDLLVVAPGAERGDVVARVTESCLDLPVRMVNLTCFCERTFGHVPVTEVDAQWLGYLMHPSFRREGSPSKRALDLVVGGLASLVFLPVLAIVAPLIRRDGGPVFFTQTRIGEGGKPFKIYKLRTMSAAPAADTPWTQADDPRVTPIGRFLRRTHLDELPQVLNILKGDMSVVGPRPEQPSYVTALEQEVPHYSRRHLIKPGLTGWAQVRCGYAGSVEGSAWKMCHDLYYVKYRSLGLDLLILGETVRTLFADRQYPNGVAAGSAFLASAATADPVSAPTAA